MIGKPYSGKPNVRFDEGELEIERVATTPALYSTEGSVREHRNFVLTLMQAHKCRLGSSWIILGLDVAIWFHLQFRHPYSIASQIWVPYSQRNLPNISRITRAVLPKE